MNELLDLRYRPEVNTIGCQFIELPGRMSGILISLGTCPKTSTSVPSVCDYLTHNDNSFPADVARNQLEASTTGVGR